MKRVFAVDLDGVLCEEGDWSPEGIITRKPKPENIALINSLFDQGNIIIIYSARREEDRPYTEAWLKAHKVKYHALVLEKLPFDYYIDERDKLLAIEDLPNYIRKDHH